MRWALNLPLIRFDHLLPLKFKVLAAVLSLTIYRIKLKINKLENTYILWQIYGT